MIRDKSLPETGPGLPGHTSAAGKPSVVPQFREIRRNFIIGVCPNYALSFIVASRLVLLTNNIRMTHPMNCLGRSTRAKRTLTPMVSLQYFSFDLPLSIWRISFPCRSQSSHIRCGSFFLSDGSSYYQTHDNYFAMAERGLKSDFGGEWHHSWNKYVDCTPPCSLYQIVLTPAGLCCTL
jgi:hypothetical protein